VKKVKLRDRGSWKRGKKGRKTTSTEGKKEAGNWPRLNGKIEVAQRKSWRRA